ncbi:MAG TPA: sortase [Gaiellales bacterium]|nr:sortase [Gaiellales bacterium]
MVVGIERITTAAATSARTPPPSAAPLAAPAGCSFAQAGTGTFASTLCWLDLSAYNPNSASKPAGQPMTVTLPGGYTIRFNLHVSGGLVAATSFPTFVDAFLGNNGHYTGVAGRPALDQTTRGTTTTATLDGITVTGPGGVPETGYAFVGADAESTDRLESITWTANTPLTLLEPVGNACNSGSGLTGVGTKTVTCSASVSNTKTGTPMLAAQAPSSIAQEMVGGGRQGVAFGVLVSTVQLNKEVTSRIDPSDAFGISIHSLPSNDLLGSANTGTADTASTGPVTVLTSDVGSSFTFAEQITSGLVSNYAGSWSCTRNGASDPALPSGDIGPSATVTLGVGDFVDCTITNTSKPVSIALQKHAGVPTDVNGNGLTDAGDTIAYTFTVTNTGVLPLSSISVSDPTAGSITCPGPTLATGASETCTADHVHTVTAADEAAGSFTNTATASGVPPGTTLPTSSPPSSATTPTESPQPLVSIIKTGVASDGFGSPLRVGETISYTYLVTNIGNVVLTSVAVDDPTLGSVTCPTPAPPGLSIGGSVTCTADSVYVVTAADVARGFVTDTATATGEGGTGGTSPPSDPSTEIVQTEPPAPEVAIHKLGVVSPVADQDAAALGDTIDYAYLVTNIGNVNLTSVAVDAPAIGSVTCPTPAPPGLAPGGSVTCSADAPHTVTQDDLDAGEVTDTATAAGVGEAGGTSPPSDPATVTIPTVDAEPQVSIVKSGSVSPPADQGGVLVDDTIAYSYVVTNTGNVSLTSVTVNDPTGGPVTCPTPSPSLAPGDSVTCTADTPYTVTQDDVNAGQVTDTATATGTGVRGGESPPSGPSTVTIPAAMVVSVSLDKLAIVDPIGDQLGATVGDTIHYAYLVTNTGNVSLNAVTVDDPAIGPVTCPTPSPPLAPLGSVVCSADNAHTVTIADVDAGFVTDTATATGTGLIGGTSGASDPATATIPTAPATPLVAIAKNGAVSPASHQTGSRRGDTISYSYLVTNIGNVDLTSVAVDDPTLGSVTCPAPAAPGLSPGDSLTCTADQTYTVSQADVDAGQVDDTATATGVGVSGGVSRRSDPSTVTIPAVAPPSEAGEDGGDGPVDGGVPVGGVQTGGRPAPAGNAARSEALIALGGLAGVMAFVLALRGRVRRSRLLGGFALVIVAAAVVAPALPGGGSAPADRPAVTAVGHPARTTPILPPSNHAHLMRTGMRVRVPAIGVDASVVSLGLNSDSTLQVPTNATDAGWWSGGTAPGGRGAAVIVGHVNWGGREGVFGRLHEVVPGQDVLVTHRNGVTDRYRVTSTAIYPKISFPTGLVYGPLPYPGLRLITCTGSFDPSTGHYADNLIVFARLTARTGPTTARTL